MKICDLNDCTGCSACANACPVHAITMQKNDEGFLYPQIDEKKCIKCGLCQRTCPMNNFDFTNTKSPKCFAVMANDELRKNSSSGAFFPVLAEYVIGNGGVVCGAVFDDNMQLHHDFAETVDDLEKMKGSKYLQSKIGDTYSRIKDFLESDRLVLFTGTPCQCAGLHNFLNKQYDNLIIADLICHGVPSQSVYDNYLQSEFAGQKVLNTNFRDKKDGWGNGCITTTMTNTTVRSLHDEEDSYMQAFFANISLRNSCYHCKFARMPRVSDFTMADFWGVPKEMDDHKGTSCILLNTPKSENIFDKIKSSFTKIKEYPCSLPISIQPHLKHSVAKHPARETFFQMLTSKQPLKKALQETIYSNKNVGLLNFHWENVNFGAVLTSYALNKYLNDNGYFARNIDYVPSFPWIAEEKPNKFFDDFRRVHMPMTRHFCAGENMSELNDEFSHFIVGSDQVWRHEFIKNDKEAYFFTFTKPNKNLISYAASFGVDKINANPDEIEDYKHMLEIFDHISVREDSGLEICKGLGINATKVIDPVFLLEKSKWDELADEFKGDLKSEQNVVFYTIDEEIENKITNFIQNNMKKLNATGIKNITFDTSVQEWLWRIKNCKFFVTDSYHGSCFAIIFNKPFVCINPNKSTTTRMRSLFDLLKISGRLYSDFNDVNIEKLPSIKYDDANKIIEKARKSSAKFLLDAISNNTERTEQKERMRAEYNTVLLTHAYHDRPYLKRKYYLYKVLSKITIGRLHKKFKKKRISYREKYYRVKGIIKQLGETK